ncbi:MAG: IS982 family transposase [Pleurocapsa sp.]
MIDWYQAEGDALKVVSPGAKPEMSNSEIITLALVMDYLPFPGETQFIGFIRANYRQWFPNLLTQSQFNRRLRKLGQMIEVLRRKWVKQLGAENATSFIIDTKPIPVMGYRRSKRHSDFHGSAGYGYCAARKMKYFGYKLVMLSTLKGLPIAYELVSANTDERKSVEAVLEIVRHCDIYGDKGFIGRDWQEEIADSTGNQIWTIHRENQQHQHSPQLKRLINKVRQRIEGVFHEIQNTGRNPERLLNKTVQGLTTHMSAKIASHTLRLLLRARFAIDVLTFEFVSPS